MLDHSVGLLKFRPSVMSIRRKWVSDTNLSKLLHETIEKKQANKQSKLPDFCKDAILSATIKKISSAMLINRKLSCSGVNDLECPEQEISDDDCSDASWQVDIDDGMTLDLDDGEFEDDDKDMKIQGCKSSSLWCASRPPLERQSPCNSPKRKRQPSSEGVDDGNCSFTDLETVTIAASPRKKRRADFLKSKSSGTNCTIDDDDWLSNDNSVSNLQPDARDHGMHARRSQSLPHLTFGENGELDNIPTNITSSSVVNSISELSIHDGMDASVGNKFCFQNNEPVDSDPLELNGFFQELNAVTVNPN